MNNHKSLVDALYSGDKVLASAAVPREKAVAFTGQSTVELKSGFSSQKGAQLVAISQKCPESVAWQYEFNIQDHLGNVRVRFTDYNLDGDITEDELLSEHHYYAFGLEMKGEWNSSQQNGTGGTPNRYKYNGKELNEELGLYDYGARNYDPTIGRWLHVDPLADEYVPHSPYNYVLNNPLSHIDPDGRSVDSVGVTFNRSTQTLQIIDYDNYQTGLPTVYVTASNFKQGGIRAHYLTFL